MMGLRSFRRLAAVAALGASGFLASAPASAIVVGGVDFGAIGDSPTNSHFETTTLAETFINGNGQELMGYGVVNTVNGDNTYAGGLQLYFVFEDYIANNFVGGPGGSVDFTGGQVRVYLGPTFNLLNQSSVANLAIIQGYQHWLTLTGHVSDITGTYTLQADGTLTGTTVSFLGSGLLDVSGGLADVVAFLDANTIADLVGGFADIVMTTSANNQLARLNQNDDLTGCTTGQAQPGQWCIAGSADLSGNTVTRVPEPASVALLGIALLGLGATARRRHS
jgi:hypothetical protein